MRRQHDDPSHFIPSEIWTLILKNLPATDKLHLRAVSKKLKLYADSKSAWHLKTLFYSPDEIIDIPNLVEHHLAKKWQQKRNMNLSELRAIFQQLSEAEMMGIGNKPDSTIEKQAKANRNAIPDKDIEMVPLITNLIGTFGCMGVTLFYLLGLLVIPSTQPHNIPLTYSCESLYCQNEITKGLQDTLIAYCLLGGTIGFFIRMIEHSWSPSVINESFASLLPTPNEIKNASKAERCRQFGWQVYRYRDSIAVSVSMIAGICLALMKPLQYDVLHYKNEPWDWRHHAIDRERLSADLLEKEHLTMGFGSVTGFMMAYSLVAVVMFMGALTKKLGTACFFQSEDGTAQEQEHLLNPQFVRIQR